MIEHLVLPTCGYRLFDIIGAMYELEKHKFYDINNIKSIYAVSGGSIIGAALCLKSNMEDIMVYSIDKTWEKEKCFNLNMNNFLDFVDEKGIVGIEVMYSFLEPFFKLNDLDLSKITLLEFYNYTKIEFNIYATNSNTLKSERFSYKTFPDLELVKAIYMSSSIPCIFKPLYVNNNYYIDGGFHIYYPINECILEDKCKDESVLSMKIENNKGFEMFNIVKEDNAFKFLYKIFLKLHTERINIDYIKNKYHLVILHNWTASSEEVGNIIKDSEMRKSYVEIGRNSAIEWLSKLDKD